MQITRIREAQAVDPLFQDYLDAKAAADRADAHLKLLQRALLERMEEKQQKTIAVTRNGVKQQVTYVKRETHEIDEKGLRKKLTAKVFDKYTKKVLDRKAMEQAMEEGVIDPMVVAPFVSEKDSAPYLRYTIKDAEEGDE